MMHTVINWKFWTKIFFQMLRADLLIFKKEVVDKIINSMIYTTTFIVISAYLLPSFGVSSSYGLMIAAGLVAGVGIFELFMAVVNFTQDLEGDRMINFYLTLPIPAWIIFAKKAVYSAITAGVISLFVLPVTKLLLWNQFSLISINWFKFALIFVVMNFFWGIMALFLVTTIKHMGQISNVWMRVVFPLYIFGGFQFTWYSMYAISPWFAIVDLGNPFVYGIEGTRAALLGQAGYLNFWLCVGVLAVLCVVIFLIALRRLKTKLDYV